MLFPNTCYPRHMLCLLQNQAYASQPALVSTFCNNLREIRHRSNMRSLTSTFITFASLSALASATSCSSYTPSGQAYSQPALRTFIISKGVTCDSTTTPCRVDIGGYVSDGRTLNLTVSDPEDLYKTISAAVDFTFNETTTQFVGGNPDIAHPSTWQIANGTAGYVGWTANHRCTAGKLSGCDDQALEGVDVEACTPYPQAGELSGTIAAIGTDRDTAVALVNCNPANTTEAKQGNYSSSCGTEDEKTGDASGTKHASMVLLLGALGVACFGFGGL